MGALVGAIDSSAGNSSSSWTTKSADADLEGGPFLGAIALLGVNSPDKCLPTPRSGASPLRGADVDILHIHTLSKRFAHLKRLLLSLAYESWRQLS